MADYSVSSMIELGGYNPSYLKSPSTPITFIQLNSNNTIFWSVDINAVRVGLVDFFDTGKPAGWTFK